MVTLPKKSWVERLPRGMREQPAWMLIGALSCLTGLSYLLGFSQSATIMRVLGPEWLRVWGGFLCLAGFMVIISTMTMNRPFEKLSLRFLSIGFMVYMGWVFVAIPPTRAMVTAALCVSIIGLAEIRVAVLKVAMRPLPVITHGEGDK